MVRSKELNGDNGTDLGFGIMAIIYPETWFVGPLLWIDKQFVKRTMEDKFGRTITV